MATITQEVHYIIHDPDNRRNHRTAEVKPIAPLTWGLRCWNGPVRKYPLGPIYNNTYVFTVLQKALDAGCEWVDGKEEDKDDTARG